MALPAIGAVLAGGARVAVRGKRFNVSSRLRKGGAKSVRSSVGNILGNVNINVETNISAFAKALDAFGKDQIPFATAGALNDTAFIVKNAVIEDTYPAAFDVKNKRFPSTAFNVDKATKKKFEAKVFDRLNKDYLVRHAVGGIKTPSGSTISIPTEEIKISGRGVPKGKRPRALLAGGKRAFRQKAKSGQDLIMQRKGKKRYPLRVLYVQEPSVKIDKTFDFYKDARFVAQKNFDKRFKINFKKAKKTAFKGKKLRMSRARR
tara:strand:+ start:192 stop:977 length:786 start_codon:yes stop_codon:yes gene_type:complete